MPYEPVSPEEADRHRQTSAVAQRIALTEAVILLDAKVRAIEKLNPGRRRGSVSAEGTKLATCIKDCADLVHKLWETINIPRTTRSPYVPSEVHDRQRLEKSVEAALPGTYPKHAKSSPPLDAGRDDERGGVDG